MDHRSRTPDTSTSKPLLMRWVMRIQLPVANALSPCKATNPYQNLHAPIPPSRLSHHLRSSAQFARVNGNLNDLIETTPAIDRHYCALVLAVHRQPLDTYTVLYWSELPGNKYTILKTNSSYTMGINAGDAVELYRVRRDGEFLVPKTLFYLWRIDATTHRGDIPMTFATSLRRHCDAEAKALKDAALAWAPPPAVEVFGHLNVDAQAFVNAMLT
jgi:hypothetical protein